MLYQRADMLLDMLLDMVFFSDSSTTRMCIRFYKESWKHQRSL